MPLHIATEPTTTHQNRKFEDCNQSKSGRGKWGKGLGKRGAKCHAKVWEIIIKVLRNLDINGS